MGERFSLGVPGGELTVREEGPRAVFDAALPDDGRGLYKAYLTGPGGRQLLLGTLMPDQGWLRLRRSFSVGELKQKGFWPPAGGEARMAFSFQTERREPAGQPQWRREDAPARLLGDRLLRQSAGRLERAMVRREGTGFALALPWRPDAAFPLTPLFCFARIEALGEGQWAVFRFNGKGCPIFPDGA